MVSDPIVQSRPFLGPYVRIRGMVSREGKVRWKDGVRTFLGPSPPPPPRLRTETATRSSERRPQYSVALSNQARRDLGHAQVTPEWFLDDQEWASFGARLPYVHEVSAIALRRGRRTLDVTPVPHQAPTIRLLRPLNPAQVDAHVLRVHCEPTSSSRARELRYFIRYSHDQEHWIRPKPSQSDGRFDLDLDEMPGGEACVVQILASNGYHTSYVQTPSFALPRRPPVILLGDLTGPLVFAQGFSREDGPLTGGAIQWLADGEEVAVGGSLNIRTLRGGDQRIVVKITDRVGVSSTQEVGMYAAHTGHRTMPEGF